MAFEGFVNSFMEIVLSYLALAIIVLLIYRILRLLIGVFSGSLFRGRRRDDEHPEATPSSESHMGPPHREYGRPNLVPHVVLCTCPNFPSQNTGRIQVSLENVSPEIIQDERIDHFQIRLFPRSAWVWGFSWPFRRHRVYTTDTHPFVIPINLPRHPPSSFRNSTFGVQVRAHNTAGYGPWSDAAWITVGQNLCEATPTQPSPSQPQPNQPLLSHSPQNITVNIIDITVNENNEEVTFIGGINITQNSS